MSADAKKRGPGRPRAAPGERRLDRVARVPMTEAEHSQALYGAVLDGADSLAEWIRDLIDARREEQERAKR